MRRMRRKSGGRRNPRRLAGVRVFGGRDYYPGLEFATKREAQQSAKFFRNRGFGARVIKAQDTGDWVVWHTH